MTYIGALWYMKLVSVTISRGCASGDLISPDDEGLSRRRRACSMLRQQSPILDPIARATTWLPESVTCPGFSRRVEVFESAQGNNVN